MKNDLGVADKIIRVIAGVSTYKTIKLEKLTILT